MGLWAGYVLMMGKAEHLSSQTKCFLGIVGYGEKLGDIKGTGRMSSFPQ